jgi:beta-glucosidase
MRPRLVVASLLALVALALLPASGAAGGVGGAALSRCPWLNQSLTVQQRVNMLLSRMSLADQIAEMYVHEPKRSHPVGNEGWVPAQPAFCIPIIYEQDGSLGVYAANDATQLPAEVSLGSAWDPTLAYQYGQVNGAEHRAKGIAMVLGPGINIDRDPRWGRNFEMFSEDPLLTSVLGSADIEGIQSQHVMADAKHFVTYNQETNRGTPDDDTIVSERALHEIYLPPFYSAVTQAQVASIMCAYPLLNGVYSCQNPSLIAGLLDARWGFTGFVRSDSAANASTVDSAKAGLDQDRGSFYWDNGQLEAAVADGEVSPTTITEAASRILTEMFRFNLFNDPPTGTIRSPASTPAHRALALKVAEQGTVLLQNRSKILPLSRVSTKSIAVIGADGSTDPVTSGGGSSHVTSTAVISPLRGLRAIAAGRIAVSSYSGANAARAAAAAARAQVAIVFASYWERETKDLKSISLSTQQNAMIAAVAAANPNTIVVLNTGGPVLMPWLSRVKGVLEAWYPGQEDGSAIAAVLFGKVDPSGHLTETFPTSLKEIPTASPSQFPGTDGKVDYSEGLDVGYRWYDAHNVTPLFPFGYGLSYTSFRFSALTVTPGSLVNSSSGPDATQGQGATLAKVTAVVTNTGSVSGSDVAQLYVGDPAVAGEPPRQLEGFQRVTLAPHQSKTVTFTVTGHELSYFSTTADGWTLPSGRFALYVGDSSALTGLTLHGTLNVTNTIGNRYLRLSAPTTAQAGTTFTATADFVNDGSLPITDGTVTFGAPAGWTVVPLDASAVLSLAPGQSATRSVSVTPPESAEGEVGSLTAALTSAGSDDAGDLKASATVSIPGPITVSAHTSAVVGAGSSTTAQLSVTSHMPESVVVSLTPTLPDGITVTPASPTVTVPADSTVELPVTVAIAPGTSPRTDEMPLDASFSYDATSYPMAATELAIDVPYSSLTAAYDNRAISNDSDITEANFDRQGDSYSEQALTAAGLGRGATVTADGATLQWPAVAAGANDNVLAEGQTILLPASQAASKLVFLGASAITILSGTSKTEYAGSGTIRYTDGTTQSYKLTFDNWFDEPVDASNTTIATAAYVNDSVASRHRAAGRRNHAARIFAVAIRLEPGKTVASVTLPTVGTLPGVYPMHIFAMGLAGPP